MTVATVPGMAEETHTPRRTVRIPDDVWRAAQAKAVERGDNLSEVIREALVKYARRKP